MSVRGTVKHRWTAFAWDQLLRRISHEWPTTDWRNRDAGLRRRLAAAGPKAVLFNDLAIGARWLADRLNDGRLWLYGFSGTLDGMSDTAECRRKPPGSGHK